jgi:hypothetical protein
VQFAALALSRFSQALVVAEDAATTTVSLKLDQVPFTKAVRQVARQANRKWTKIYALQPSGSMVVARTAPAEGAAPPPPGEPATTVRLVTNNVVVAPRQPDPAEQARMMEALFATMTPAERQKAEQQIATMQEIQSLPEAERQVRMQEMAAQARQESQANIEQRMRQRLRDGTADQRVARDREMLNRQKAQPAPRP